MKVRNGFVSNSSSSSFILKFDKNRNLKDQVSEMLDKVVIVFDLEEDIQYCITEKDINEEDYENYEQYHKALLDTYKEHVLKDLVEDLECPMDKESIREDLETIKHISEITFDNWNLIKNSYLLHYNWNTSRYYFDKDLAQRILDDNENTYHTISISDHWNEDRNYDGKLEFWLEFNTQYVVKYESNH